MRCAPTGDCGVRRAESAVGSGPFHTSVSGLHLSHDLQEGTERSGTHTTHTHTHTTPAEYYRAPST